MVGCNLSWSTYLESLMYPLNYLFDCSLKRFVAIIIEVYWWIGGARMLLEPAIKLHHLLNEFAGT